ncbi:MAG: hypothetical protein ACW979_03340 [Candidatus Thorarchaeota archaeon]
MERMSEKLVLFALLSITTTPVNYRFLELGQVISLRIDEISEYVASKLI